jgi:hypothetical protein
MFRQNRNIDIEETSKIRDESGVFPQNSSLMKYVERRSAVGLPEPAKYILQETLLHFLNPHGSSGQ